MPATNDSLDLGRLLRVQAMVTEAAQTQATMNAAVALVRAYMGLRNEVLLITEAEDLKELRDECERLFPVLGEPPRVAHQLDTGAAEALLNLRKLGGWIQGLINELTLEQRMRMEAEERAKLQDRPSTGFAS
jgi:hypothetical protein